MSEPVEGGGAEQSVGEGVAPLGEVEVGGDGGALFVALGDEVVEVLVLRGSQGFQKGRPEARWSNFPDNDRISPALPFTMRIDGEVTTGILGADAEWSRLLAGVDISVSEGEGGFSQPGVDSGTIESSLTTVSPQLELKLDEFTARAAEDELVTETTSERTITVKVFERRWPRAIKLRGTPTTDPA